MAGRGRSSTARPSRSASQRSRSWACSGTRRWSTRTSRVWPAGSPSGSPRSRRAHPRRPIVLAHAAMPDYAGALDLVHRYERVYIDTTMVGTPFAQETMPVPADWAARLAGVADRVVLGTDFPNIPCAYVEQIRAI